MGEDIYMQASMGDSVLGSRPGSQGISLLSRI